MITIPIDRSKGAEYIYHQIYQQDWQAKRDQFVARGVSNGNRHLAAKGEGAVLYDIDGRRFIDFAGAIGTLNVGHSHRKVVEAVKRQAEQLIIFRCECFCVQTHKKSLPHFYFL